MLAGKAGALLDKGKHTSLSSQFVGYHCKRFCNIGPQNNEKIEYEMGFRKKGTKASFMNNELWKAKAKVFS